MNRFKEVYRHIIDLRYASSQQEFSKMTGISRTVVSQLLNDRRELTDKQILKIGNTYPFVNLEWLRDGVGDMFMYDVPEVPTSDDLVLDELQAREWIKEQSYLARIEQKADQYEAKAKEVQELYSRLVESMNKLLEKEKEIANLNSTIQSQIKTIQLLKKQLAITASTKGE